MANSDQQSRRLKGGTSQLRLGMKPGQLLRRPKLTKGATLTCAKYGHRGRRDTARSRCPMCGARASAGDT